MPVNVRNFWITANIDGRAESLEGGPKGAGGGFDQTIYIRDKGTVTRILEIRGTADNGRLRLSVEESLTNGKTREVYAVYADR